MRKLPAILLLAAACFLAYAPAMRNGFVWDDTALILRDPLIRSWRLIPEGFQHFLFTDATASDFYRPIQRLTYTLEYAAFGFRAAPHHFFSVFWHFMAAVAVFLFAGEFLRFTAAGERIRRTIPLLVSVIWALHPLHTSAVAYIAGRADPLAAAFGFAGLYLGLLSLRLPGARMWIATAAAGTAFLLSVLSKESGIVLPIIWIVFLTLQRMWRPALRAGVALLFVLTIYGTLRFGAEHVSPEELRPAAPLHVRPILAARAVAEYAGLLVLPLNLHMERDVETHPDGFGNASLTASAWRELQTLAGAVLLGGFIYWTLRSRKRDRGVFLCLVATAIAYLPISGVVRLNASVAEHWIYLPSVFLFLAATLTLSRAFLRWTMATATRWIRPAATATVALWMLFLGGRTFIRCFDWRDQRTFLERSIAAGGDTARMHINLASLDIREGRLDDAAEHLRIAMKKEPDQPFAVLNLATLAVQRGDFTQARELLQRAAGMSLVAAQAHELLAVLGNRESGDVDLVRLRLATRTGPPNWSILKRYLKVLDEAGLTEKAMVELQSCLHREWYRAESWQLMGEFLDKAGRPQQAAVAFHRARLYDVRLTERPVLH